MCQQRQPRPGVAGRPGRCSCVDRGRLGPNGSQLGGSHCLCGHHGVAYFTSMRYHALPPGRAKRVFLQLDYCAIFLFLARSYTPFALGALRGRLSHPWASTGLYLAMGWLVLIAAVPLVERVPTHPGWQSVHRCHFRLSTAPKRPPPNKSAFAAAPLPKP